MGRPIKIEKRDQQLNVRLTMREICLVRDRSKAAGLRLGEFARDQILRDGTQGISESAEGKQSLTLLVTQLSRLGNNLNQIARRFHQIGLPAPSELAPLLGEVRDCLAECWRRDR